MFYNYIFNQWELGETGRDPIYFLLMDSQLQHPFTNYTILFNELKNLFSDPLYSTIYCGQFLSNMCFFVSGFKILYSYKIFSLTSWKFCRLALGSHNTLILLLLRQLPLPTSNYSCLYTCLLNCSIKSFKRKIPIYLYTFHSFLKNLGALDIVLNEYTNY